MDSERKRRNTGKGGDGYYLFPWGEAFREGGLADWSDAALAVLPVIAAHANRDGEAWPSYDTICAYARVSKSKVREALDELIAGGWIVETKQQGRNTHNRYRLCFGNDAGKSREHIALHHKLVKLGVWGAMTPSTRRVYLIFRAFAYAGLSAIGNGYEFGSYDDPEAYYDDGGEPIKVRIRGKWREFCFTKVQFLPRHIYDPARFEELSGVPERTFRKARAWLVDMGLICPYVCDLDDTITGLIIPLRPVVNFPHVLEAVEKAKKESRARAKTSSGAKRGFTAMLRKTTLGKTGPSAS